MAVIYILGLRRSGTTVFWNAFKRVSSATCFDEPFNPLHIQLPQPHVKKTNLELVDLLQQDAPSFWKAFAPISSIQELNKEFEPAQATYLRFLINQNEHTVIDSTRCQFKIAALKNLLPDDSLVIHLHRSPAGFAGSHLIPNFPNTKWRNLLAIRTARKMFWNMDAPYNSWQMEEIIGRFDNSPFAVLHGFEEFFGIQISALSSIEKLLAYWRYAFETVERDGRDVFGDHFVSVSYDSFCANPKKIIGEMSVKTRVPIDLDAELPRIHSPKPIYDRMNSKWDQSFKRVGLHADHQMQFQEDHEQPL